MKRKFLHSLIVILALSAGIFAQNQLKKWHKIDFAKTAVKKAELNQMDAAELSLLRGVVFGRRGRVFKERFVQDYLAKQAWYKPNPNFDNKVLTQTERRNIDAIREVEKQAVSKFALVEG